MGYEELSPAPPEAMTDGSETHPLSNLERHVQHGTWVTRDFTKWEGKNMPVIKKRKKGGREGGDNQGATRIDNYVRKP